MNSERSSGKYRSYKGIVFVLILMAFWQSWARQPSEADFLAARIIAEDFSVWISKISNRPGSLGIFYIRANAPFDSEFSNVMESQIVKALQAEPNIQVASCNECRTPQIELREDRLVVKKGAPDNKSLTEMGKKLAVEAFMMADVYRTPISVVMNVTLYQASSGQIIAAEEFKAPSLDWSDSALQVVISVGPAIVSGGDPSRVQAASKEFHFLGSLSVLEEIGFGKGGLVIGGTNAGSQGSLFYANPTLGWRGRFGKTNIQSLFGIGAGYGYSNNTGGLAARVSYDIFIGSFTNLGVEAVTIIPLRSTENKPLSSSIGIHMGFSLGR